MGKEKKAKKRSHEESPKKLQFENSFDQTPKSPKKKKKNKSAEELQSGTDHHESSDSEKVMIHGWPQGDVEELLRRIGETASTHMKSLKSSNVINKIKWNQIKFKNYSEEQCQEMWKYVDNMQRKYRTFSEILNDASVWVKNPSHPQNNHRKEVHPDRPKPPLGLFLVYQQHKREELQSKYPNLKGVELAKKLGEGYRGMSESEKSYFQKLVDKQKRKYEKKLAKFYDKYPVEREKIKEKRSAKVPDPNKVSRPKKAPPNYHPTLERPRKPFQLFVEHKKSKLGENPSIEKGALEEEWRDLKTKRKVKWIKKVLEQEDEYRKMVNEFNAENGTDYIVPATVTTKEEREMVDRSLGKPVKPPATGLSLFTSERLKNKEKMAEINLKWKRLSIPEQESYVQRVKEMQEQYKAERTAYLNSCSPEERDRFLEEEKKKKKPSSPKAVPKGQTTLDSSVIRTAREPQILLEPRKPPKDEFELYKEIQLKANPKLLTQQIAASFRQLPSDQKTALKTRLIRLQTTYQNEFSNYLDNMTPGQVKEYFKKVQQAEFGEGPSSKNANSNHQLSDDDDDDDDDDDERQNEPVANSPIKRNSMGAPKNKSDSSDESSNDEKDTQQRIQIPPQIAVKKLEESCDSETDSSSTSSGSADS